MRISLQVIWERQSNPRRAQSSPSKLIFVGGLFCEVPLIEIRKKGDIEWHKKV